MGAQHTGGEVHAGHPGHPGPLYQPPAPDDPAMVGGHRIAARLGVGALGPVYLAYAPDGRPVALTAVRPELAARSGFAAAFEHDVQAVRRVHGPYAVPVLGSGHDGTRYWLAAGYVPALTLHAAVSDSGRPLPVPIVLRLVAGVAEALRAVHHAGVVHAGLGPGTVLLAADGPRVTGYGVTRATADSPGIPAFSSPEQAADKPPVPATDVFALGQIAAYAAIGAAPFGARALHEEPDLSELPGELREIVTRCLIKDPALRPSPSQVIAMCTQATHHRPPTPWLPTFLQTLLTLPPPLPPLPPPGTWPRPTPPPPGGTPAHGLVPGAPAAPSAPPAGPGGLRAPAPPPAAPGPGPGVPVLPAGSTPPGGTAIPAPGARPAPPSAPPATPVGGAAPRMPTGPVTPAGATRGGATTVPPGAPLGGQPGEPYREVPRGTGTRGRRRAGGWVAAAVVTVVGALALGGLFGWGHGGAGQPRTDAAQAGPPGQREYDGVGLDAGDGLVLETDPPQTRPGAENGTFGYSPDGESFVSAATRGALVLLGPRAPGTLDGCRAAGDLVGSVPRTHLTAGSRLCVVGADGTTALVTFRQLSAPGGPSAHATLDLTVWPARQL
ncbi:serine/threonine-protein kinase [Streptomyces sp. NBC_01198]|uniref:serine/threonine-protein kinase n=1 Tax=Streptomyces sp. NBC_01198 TaxID=2903769 RepID=UPI002E11DE4D|nr:serine/threonine protein kinase [Streptomyces sp. NBC_01198]